MKYCRQCGAPSDDAARFCPKCGTPFPAGNSGPSSGRPDPRSARPGSAGGQGYGGGQGQNSYGGQGQHNPGGCAPGGYGPQYGRGVPSRRPVKDDRSLIAYILLSIITLSIYGWYFIYSVARDTNEMCRGDGRQTAGLIKYVLLSIITCGIYSLYWGYSVLKRLSEAAPAYGVTVTESPASYVLWIIPGILLCGLGPFVSIHILIKNLNLVGRAYNYRNGF